MLHQDLCPNRIDTSPGLHFKVPEKARLNIAGKYYFGGTGNAVINVQCCTISWAFYRRIRASTKLPKAPTNHRPLPSAMNSLESLAIRDSKALNSHRWHNNCWIYVFKQ